MHYAIQNYYSYFKKHEKLASVEQLNKYFENALIKFKMPENLFNKNLIEPDKLLLPKKIKNKTPYITMIISDGKQSQKFQFISSDTGCNTGSSWDIWVLLNSDKEYSRNVILLNNKNWHISFKDYLNKDLDMGKDCIKILRINKHDKDNDIKIDEDIDEEYEDNEDDCDEIDECDECDEYNIIISKKINDSYDLNLINKFEYLLLSCDDGVNIPIKVLEIDVNVIKVNIEKQYEINTNSNYYLLNYKAQYTIILSYYPKL
jgi:hypothetical protein